MGEIRTEADREKEGEKEGGKKGNRERGAGVRGGAGGEKETSGRKGGWGFWGPLI